MAAMGAFMHILPEAQDVSFSRYESHNRLNNLLLVKNISHHSLLPLGGNEMEEKKPLWKVLEDAIAESTGTYHA